MKTKKYYRKITEALPQGLSETVKKSHKEFVKTVTDKDLHAHFPRFVFFFPILMLAFLGLYLGVAFLNYQTIQEERLKLSDNFAYWEDVAKTHPNSPDAYYNAAIYAYDLQNRQKALELLERATQLDPTFAKAIKLEKEILK